jgi:hypothetical protein
VEMAVLINRLGKNERNKIKNNGYIFFSLLFPLLANKYSLTNGREMTVLISRQAKNKGNKN